MPPTSSSLSAFGSSSGNGSTSAIVADTATGWHEFRIDCYSATKGLGNGRYLNSSNFNAGGHSWHIAYYPKGLDAESIDSISVYVFLKLVARKDAVVKARYKFSLLDKQGKPDSSFINSSQVEVFKSNSTATSGWGFKRFIVRDAAWERSKYVRDDCFSIRCDVTVILGLRTDVVVPLSDLHRDIGALLSTGEGADVTFNVGGEMLAAHSNVLGARSSVFKAELFGPLKAEKAAGPVLIVDMESYVFKALLHFIYTDSLPDMEEGEEIVMAQHLLVAADRYDLKRLKQICEDILSNHIEKSTVATTLVLAEQHGCQELKDACLAFLMSPGNFNLVMTTDADGFDHLRKSCPSLLEELVANLDP
ncbi:unnamed protein product [Urochloa decumbens]|uniref:Uncharacterized protein n=1 Tax=Urochloa decumbens TaxID=240449 RepID=A0ABC9ANA4_9POAL